MALTVLAVQASGCTVPAASTFTSIQQAIVDSVAVRRMPFHSPGSVQTAVTSPLGKLRSCNKETSDLRHEARCLRKQYDQASAKVGSLRENLRTSRRAVTDRDKQLSSTSKALEHVAAQRDTLQVRMACACSWSVQRHPIAWLHMLTRQVPIQAELDEQKAANRKLEDRLMRACPPSELRSQLRTQQQRVLVLLEEVETARAAANATQDVVQKYEREVYMLQRALNVHAAEFQHSDEDSVHSSLILALAEVCQHAVPQLSSTLKKSCWPALHSMQIATCRECGIVAGRSVTCRSSVYAAGA